MKTYYFVGGKILYKGEELEIKKIEKENLRYNITLSKDKEELFVFSEELNVNVEGFDEGGLCLKLIK